ncbi:putative T7SS-secreted protein [Nocardia sp. NPDC051030]|uniref:putative T7SS-secreted protein n=1 Tax=Nocardia sp. NPDC051030 TaxID=3155162 RepID=UPI00341B7977
MGIGDFIDKVGDAIENAVEDVETKAGSILDKGAHTVGELVRDAGADGLADAIEDIGDQIADVLGGEITEKELGQTKDKTELIRGEPSAIHDVIEKLHSMSGSIESTGDALKTIDVADWTGRGASAFHTAFDKQPKLWWTAGDAFTKAAAHLDNWYWAVQTGQAKAQEAIDKWEAADREEKSKKDAWNALPAKDKKNKSLTDSWSSIRDEARAILKAARAQRDSIAAQIASGIEAETSEAPTEPPFTQRMIDDVEDLKGVYDYGKVSFNSGLITSFSSIVQFARSTNILDPYNMSHPAAYFGHMADLGTGLVTAAADPGATVSAVLSDARKNPFEAGGAITGNILLTVATGGAGGAAKMGAQAVDEINTATRLAKTTTSLLEDTPGLTPRAVPKVEAPSLPGRTAPGPGQTLDTGAGLETRGGSALPGDARAGSAVPADTRAGAGVPGETRAGAGVPGETRAGSGLPADTRAGPAAAPEGGPAAGPHPDGAAPQANPGDGSAAPHQQADNVHGDSAPSHARPDSDSGVPHQEKPGGSSPDQPREQVDPRPHPASDPASAPHNDPNTAAPHNDSPGEPHGSGDPNGTGVDHDPAHPGDHNGTDPAQPEHNPTFEHNASADHQAPDHARSGHPEDTSDIPDKTTCGDPVDVATGAFLLPETDIDLPGVLSLVLRRTHRSSYRFGRWFGPSWSATLDMRLIVDSGGVTFLGEEGLMLAFPHAEVDIAAKPEAGGRNWTLTRTESGFYQVRDPRRELIFHFAPEADLGGLDARLGNLAISAITDRHHNRVRFHYSPEGAPTAVTHSGGYRVVITTAAGRITALSVITEHNGHQTPTRIREFTYAAGNLVAVTNAVDATTSYTYDVAGRMLSWTDSNNNSMVNTYDEAGRVVRQRGTSGVLNCDLSYQDFPDGTGLLTTVTNSLGAVTAHGFDRDLRLRDLVNPVGAHTHFDYNAEREPLKVIAPDGAITRYAYTGSGDVARIVRPDGSAIDIAYSSRNRPIAVTDADGAVRHQEWDAQGNLTASIDAADVRTEYRHHPGGSVAEILESTGARTIVDIDAAGLPIRVADPTGATTQVERDGFGRPLQVTDPVGAVTRFEWSHAGKLLRRTDPDGFAESWTWDGEGNLLTHTDRADHLTVLTYGAFDLLASRTDPDGSITRYRWDSERRLTAVINPLGHTWTYEYDQAGRLASETDYNEATTSYTHDRVGRIASVTTANGETRHHTHDVLGRVTEIVADSDDWLRYRHDPAGRVIAASSGNGETAFHTIDFTYTATGHLASQRLDDQAAMEFAYDAHGRRIARTTPNGATTAWQWNHTGRVQGMTADSHHISFAYDAVGRPTGWRVGEIAVNRDLSEIGRVTAQQVIGFPASTLNLAPTSSPRPNPRDLRLDTYAYRPDGYLTTHTISNTEGPAQQRDYTLDAIGRVTALANNGSLTTAYSYDPLSNITSVESPGTSRTSDADATDVPATKSSVEQRNSATNRREYHRNLLIRDGRTRYHYDPAGRLVRKVTTRLSRKPDTWHYTYNAFDQLTEVRTPDGQRWHYTCDPAGRRTTKQRLDSDDAVLERIDYTWDGTYLVEQTVNESTTRWHYQPTSRAPITQTTDQTSIDRAFHAIITDLVGTPIDLVDPETAEPVATATVDLWGATSWHGSADTPLRFPGQFHDPESGLHYNLNRIYDPSTGRFLTQDPLGLSPAPNPGAYPHNPTVWSDPLGLMPEGCHQSSSSPDQGAQRDPTYGNGGHIDNISPNDARRIQNAANARGVEIHVVGSRASGNSHAFSDWDYLIPDSNSRLRSRIKSSLPMGPVELGYGRRIDVLTHPPTEGLPYITFYPN